MNFLKTRGVCQSRGEIIFAKQGECTETRENREEIRNLCSMTKKSHHKFLRMKIEKKFREKVKFRKFSTESEIFSKIWGKSETGGEIHHGLRGMDAPARRINLLTSTYILQSDLHK